MDSKLTLKVKRGEFAKEFPLLHIAKEGDVGLDVPVILPLREGYEDDLKEYIKQCAKNGKTPDKDRINNIKHDPIKLYPGHRILVSTDIRLEIPAGYWIAIEARSSTSKQSLIIPKGVIDEGYRGELFAQVINVGALPVYISHGDRLIQLILRRNYTKDLYIKEVDELSKTERGESGFGSSGRSSI